MLIIFCLITLEDVYRSLAEEGGDAFVDAAEAHESKCQEACGDEGDGHTLDTFGDAHEAQLLAQTGKHDEREGEAEGGSQGVDDAGEEVGLEALTVIGAIGYEDGHTEDTAVGGDQGKEHAQRLIERGRELLEHDLDHLHQGGNHEDEDDGLQVLQVEGVEYPHLKEVGDDGGDNQHKGHGKAHTFSCLNLLRHAEEGTDAQELRQHNVVDEYR